MSDSLSPQFASLLLNEDLCMLVARFTPTYALLRWKSWPKHCSRVAEIEIRKRVFALLSVFMPLDAIPEFLILLERQGTVVAGGFVQYLLLLESEHKSKELKALDLVMPHSRSLDAIYKFFRDHGYKERYILPIAAFRDHVRSVDCYERELEDGKMIRVYVYQSKKGPLSVVLNAPCSAWMNVLTHLSILSFFPGLSFANKGLWADNIALTDEQREELMLDNAMTSIDDNSSWAKPCGFYCPMMWRKPLYDRGLAEFKWVSGVKHSGPGGWNSWCDYEDIRVTDIVMWRMLKRCRNKTCVHAQKYEERSNYVFV